jgi:hypothetical protein
MQSFRFLTAFTLLGSNTDAKRNYDMISSKSSQVIVPRTQSKQRFPQPKGRPFKGHIWDSHIGKWIKRPSKSSLHAQTKNTEGRTRPCAEGIRKSCPARSDKGLNMTSTAKRVKEDGPIDHAFGFTDSSLVFQLGEIVYVKEHSWSGVNNPAGFCVVLKSYKDENDDLLYDLRYIIDKRSKLGIYSKYVSNSCEHGWIKS